MKLVSLLTAGLALAGASAFGEVAYRVKVNPTDKRLEITMVFPAKGADPIILKMPRWSPGAYAYHGESNVRDLTAVDSGGRPLAVSSDLDGVWNVAIPGDDGPVTVHYWLPTGGGRFGAFGGGDPSFVQVSGPSTYLYLDGRKMEPCRVTFEVPEKWPVVVGLDAAGKTPNTFKAPTYDVLADNPMSTGDIIVDHYKLRGKDHYVVLEGAAKGQVNREKLLRDCRFVSAAETDFWGGAPYHKYVWHFTVRPGADGAGGLEHLSSTQISLAAGEGPLAQSVLSHEYFHLWNVKRIRSRVLGPFDYDHLPKTGALWWLEGVTDYYAWLLPYRYGEWERPMFLNGIVRNYMPVESNPAHLTVSANEASLKVSEANGGRGNSNGFQISYYNLGWLAGLCLDTEIRVQSRGKHSLDDVAHALYQLCKDDKPGFAEDEIRKQCIRFGGPRLGPFYDKVVMTPGEMPIAEQLAKMGFKLETHQEPFAQVGFVIAPNFGGGGGRAGGNGPSMRIASAGGPAEGKLQTGDQVSAINGMSLEGKSPMDVMTAVRAMNDGAKVGVPITLTVVRDGTPVDVTIVPVEAMRKVMSVSEDPAATPEAKALAADWLLRKKPAVE